MKYYSFLTEALDNLHESVILDNVVYHGSQVKMTTIKGGFTQDKRFGYNCVYVTPFKYGAAHFIFDGDTLFNEVVKRNPEIKDKMKEQFCCGAYQKAIWCYRSAGLKRALKDHLDDPVFMKKIQTTYPKKSILDVHIKDKNGDPIFFKDFNCKLTGYVYYIDYSKYKNKSFFDNDKHYEFVIKGDVKPFKIDKVTVDFTLKYWDGTRK